MMSDGSTRSPGSQKCDRCDRHLAQIREILGSSVAGPRLNDPLSANADDLQLVELQSCVQQALPDFKFQTPGHLAAVSFLDLTYYIESNCRHDVS